MITTTDSSVDPSAADASTAADEEEAASARWPDGPRTTPRSTATYAPRRLLLLLERPMHGYEMILEVHERSGEAWSPSPGAIYPTIQLLSDKGLITTHDQDGKKVSSLTEAGRTAAEELAATKTAPWDEASSDAGEGCPQSCVRRFTV